MPSPPVVDDGEIASFDDAPAEAPQHVAVPPAQAREVAATAARFAARFARPLAPGQDGSWWAAVAPLLTAQSRVDFAGTDPSTVPYTTVLGAPRIVPFGDGTQLVAAVQVPTDAGPFEVIVVPAPDGSGWLVSQAALVRRSGP